jgi:hypothetical protein
MFPRGDLDVIADKENTSPAENLTSIVQNFVRLFFFITSSGISWVMHCKLGIYS